MEIKTRHYVPRAFLMLAATFLFIAGSAQPSDLSGSWKLNDSRSKFNGEYSFAPLRITIVQEENSMSIERVSEFQGEEFTRQSAYTLDGKESKNEGFQGAEIISVASWEKDGKTLNLETTLEMMDGGELLIKARYKLDGDNLVIENAMEGGPMGDGPPETWVYDRQAD